ncbi:hypothetical protein B0I08_10297 [Glaciihabitans tibetensis]|uniref:Mannosyltransferase PIG-V n=1 Tax=Glaciihabitans tibetensis TaxID=1266600 RepID=A0A2T0VGT5_9MICO|nr:hypothetical protein [Glaciihabitans tibetensis]PRY69424.1 hypothetical protein B0I08_10297 [Glaciihabitans tibetensis]
MPNSRTAARRPSAGKPGRPPAPVDLASSSASYYARTPWWAKVLVVFLVSRVVTTILLLIFASMQAQNPWTAASPDYFSFASIWDGHWYYIVSVAGYPSDLPVTADGHIGENAWAFMPAYPMLVRLIGAITGGSFAVVAVWVSVGFALGAALMFYRLMALVLPGSQALYSVVLFCFAPLSPILQVAYAESMGLFFLTLGLYLLLQRRYWLLLLVIVPMSLTRPSGLAFALMLGLHVIYRWTKRRTEPFPVPERVAAVVAGGFSAAMGFAWPLIAWAVTGSASAYTDTELAWRASYVGYGELVPFAGWIAGANWWVPEPLGVLLLILAVALFACAMFTPWVRRIGVDLRLWVASYALYLLAVFFPQSSTFRLLMPMFPLWGALAQPRSRTYRILLVLVLIAGQVGWIYIGWLVGENDWTPP